eukprot:Awhi_evm1s15502
MYLYLLLSVIPNDSAFLIANGYGQFPVTCDNDVIVNFQFHFIETTSIPRYRLDRNRVGPNDRNCIGTV